jgi:hypothetical protein
MLQARFAYALMLAIATAWAVFGQSAGPQILPSNSSFNAFIGETFSQSFSCTNCGTNPIFSISSQSPLPPGLSFSPATRTLSGVPTVPNQSTFFSVIVSSSGSQVGSRSYSITTDRRLTFLTGNQLQAATAGIPVNRSIQTNLASAWDNGSSNLPNSVTLSFAQNSTTATISGIFPSVSSPTTYNVQLYASYPYSESSVPHIYQTIDRVFLITVNPPPTLSANVPPGQVGFQYAAGVTVSGGTAPYTFGSAGNLPPGLGVNAVSGLISGIPTAPGTFPFQVTVRDANGATAFATVTVVVTGIPLQIISTNLPPARVAQNYSTPLIVTGGTAPYTWSIINNTLPPPGISIATSIAGASLAGIPNAFGIYPFTIQVRDIRGLTAQANVSIVVNPALLTISTTTLPNFTPNVAYQTTLSVTGGVPPYAWVLSSGALPAGVTLRSDGVLIGTPTASGTFSFGVRVTDSPNSLVGYQGGAATRDFVMTLSGGPLSIAPETLPASVVGQPFTPVLTANGGVPPYTWSVSAGTLPPGVTFGANGAFAGAPTAVGLSSFTVQVRDSVGQTATRAISLSTAEGLSISTPSLDDGVVGVAYNVTLAAANGTAPYTYSVSGGALPSGLALSLLGVLTGTPTVAGTFNVTIRALDSGNLAATRNYTLLIRPALSIVTETLANGNAGTAYTAQVTAAGGFPGYTFAVASGSLPPGLTLASGGSLSGTPTVAGAFTFGIRATDSRNFTTTRNYTVTITQVTLPPVTVTQITDTTAPGSQPTFGIALGSAFPAPIEGTVTLAFTPAGGGPADPDVRFANGGTTLNFAIPTGSLNAVPAAGTLFAFSAGTTAGTVTLTVVARSNGQVLLPNPAAVRTIRIEAAGPTISSVRINRTATGFEVLVIGFSNTRQMTSGNLRFNPAPGVTLASAEFPINVAPFQTWYASAASAAFGTQFLLTIPFTVADGTAASLSSVLVTLTNSSGSGSGLGNF